MTRTTDSEAPELHRATGPAGDRAAYRWLSTSDLMERMGGSRQKIIDMILDGDFGEGPKNVVKWGREYRVSPEALDRYMRTHAVEAR